MFLRRSRSIDVLGSSKKVDAQQSGSEMKKSKLKLKSMRSFRFLKSPRLGSPPESGSKNLPQTPATRLDGSSISTPLSDAHGLGIKHSTGPGMPGSSSETRPVPHARMYSPYSAMSTDIFSTSRPPGTGMRLPPSRTDANVAQDPYLDWELTPDMAAPASEPLPSVSVFPQMSEPHPESMHSVWNARLSPTKLTPEATKTPDNAEVSQSTWPPYQTDPVRNIEDAYYNINEAPEDHTVVTMQGYAMQSDVTAPTSQLEAAAITSPVPPSGRNNDQAQPASRPASLSDTVNPSLDVVDALVHPYDSNMDETVNRPESWTLSEPENAQPTADDALMTQGDEDAARAATMRTSVKPDHHSTVTAEPPLHESQDAAKPLPPANSTHLALHDKQLPQVQSHPEPPVSALPTDASYYRVECMLGSHVLVCNDPIVRTEVPKPVAYTYDTWYLEPSNGQTSANITAIVLRVHRAKRR